MPRETRTQIHLRALLETNDLRTEHVESHTYGMRRTMSGLPPSHTHGHPPSLAPSLALSATTPASKRRTSQMNLSRCCTSSGAHECQPSCSSLPSLPDRPVMRAPSPPNVHLHPYSHLFRIAHGYPTCVEPSVLHRDPLLLTRRVEPCASPPHESLFSRFWHV